MTIAIILLVALILFGMYNAAIKSTETLAHWSHLIDGLNYSAEAFYEELNAELKAHNIDGLKTETTVLSQGGVFSANRLYLRVMWRNMHYDVCLAPFGNGSFVSWWLYDRPGMFKLAISKIPVIGSYISRTYFSKTTYEMDTQDMFKDYAQNTVMKLVDKLCKGQNIKSLPENLRIPVLHSLMGSRLNQ